MRLKAIFSLQFFFSIFCFSQTYDPFIEQLMNQTNMDSLVSYVRILSGGDSVVIGGSTVLIERRVSSTGNDQAADYIKEKLTPYGLEIYDQQYSASGRNIYAIQRGTVCGRPRCGPGARNEVYGAGRAGSDVLVSSIVS